MDSKKMAIQIKPAILAADKKEWSVWNEPYWRQRQLNEGDSSVVGTRNQKPLRPWDGSTNILDRLVRAGETDMDNAIHDLENKLRPNNPAAGDLYFNGNGRDFDLAAPWLDAEERAKGNPVAATALKRLQERVREFQKGFRRLNVDSVKKITTNVQRRAQLREICKDFASFRVDGDVFICDPLGDYTLRDIKASCAYVCDLEKRGGEENGFVWHVAIRDLCKLKANAVGGGHTVTIPFTTAEKLDISKNWG
jgi:hypothetical protein